MKKLLTFLFVLISIPTFVFGATTANSWVNQPSNQLYTNTGNGLGNATIHVAGCVGCGASTSTAVISIGSPVLGSTYPDIFFASATSSLDQSPNLTFSSDILSVPDINSTTLQTSPGILKYNDTVTSLDWKNGIGYTMAGLDAFNYSDNSNLRFGSIDNGTNLITNGTNGDIVLQSSGITQFFGNNSTGSQQFGDVGYYWYHDILSINDSTRYLSFSDQGNEYFSIDVTNRLYKFGDQTPTLHGTLFTIDDTSKAILARTDDLFWVGDSSNNPSLEVHTGANTVSISNAYVLPNVDGTSNYVMSTNGSGTVSWVDANTLIPPPTITLGVTEVGFGNASTGVITSSPTFTFDDSPGVWTTKIGMNGQTNLLLDVNDGLYNIGDTTGLLHSSIFSVNDASSEFDFSIASDLLSQITPQAFLAKKAVAFDGMTKVTSGNPAIADNVYGIYYDPTTIVATATIKLPASPIDGQEVLISFGGTIATGATVIGTLTVSPTAGQTIEGTLPVTAVGGQSISFKYRSFNSTWYRLY